MIESNKIESFLAREEGKTLEFKENCRPLAKIIQTVVAFANTAGGILLLKKKGWLIHSRTVSNRS